MLGHHITSDMCWRHDRFWDIISEVTCVGGMTGFGTSYHE